MYMTREKRRSIYEFNHIDKSLNDNTINEIKSLYTYYHKRWWCYKKAFKTFKMKNLAINISSVGLVVVGTIVGGVTLNPIILGTVSGTGILIKSYCEIKNFSRKIETCKFAYTTYQKSLTELRSCLRGNHFDHNQFINNMKLIDEIIIDMCPLVDKFEKQYAEKFTTK